MRHKNSKSEFVGLLMFLIGSTLVLTNGFSAHIFAKEADRFEQITPIAEAISHILRDYVYEPDFDQIVEGALYGIMNSLDRNSSFIPARGFKAMREETEGAFDGIGVVIRPDEEGRITVFEPIVGSPAAEAGIRAGDIIHKVDGVSMEGMTTGDAANRIKGPRGRKVDITVLRAVPDQEELATLDFTLKRGKIPLQSIDEARVLEGGIGYVRISDFKKNTAKDLKSAIESFKEQDFQALVLDLRWNPGGLLGASRDVSELFLPKHSLVTKTRGREDGKTRSMENMTLRTERDPIVPTTLPIIVLTNGGTASSSEIVTGALQFHQRAIVVGEKSFGKGSVQTIIPLQRPTQSALRLTTALYYTPADVTIHGVGIQPDVAVVMDDDTQLKLRIQMIASYEASADLRNSQNHGAVTGNEVTDETVEDLVLAKAVALLEENPVFADLLKNYHRDVSETQVAAVDGEEGDNETADDSREVELRPRKSVQD